MKVIYELGPKSMTVMIVPSAEQAKELEEKIAIASEAHYTPSVMELELQTRLNQLTDHLIQKQAQVLLFIVLNGSLFSSCKTLPSFGREYTSTIQSLNMGKLHEFWFDPVFFFCLCLM
jgi:hypothetical protein